MLPEIPAEQARAAIEGVAREILVEAGMHGPPIDALALARRLDIVVARDARAVTRARCVRIGAAAAGGQHAILLADEPRPERRQWAVAHEIGETQAFRVFAALGVDPVDAPPAARENIANRLASCLLLPFESFLDCGVAVDWDLVELKCHFATASHELIARRMLEMPPPVIITLADHGRQQWRRSNRQSSAPPLTTAELDAWQAAQRLAQPTRCDAGELPEGIDDVRAWPIHEPPWRREIIRTALADEW